MEKDEYEIDEKCKLPHKKLKVEDLDSIDTHVLYHPTEQNKSDQPNDFSIKKKLFYIIGGIHGDELQGIKAVEHLQSYFSFPKSTFAQNLRSSINIVLIPVINNLGFLAGLRNSPCKGTQICLLKEGRIFVEEKEVFDIKTFSMKILRTNPDGWTDPNRLWEENKTLVKSHLEKIVWEKPEYILFLHDWTDFFGGFICYGNILSEKINPDNCMKRIFEKYQMKKNTGAKEIEYFSYYDKNDQNITGWHLFEKYGICNFTLENFAYSEESQKIHFSISLLILALISNLNIATEELENLIIKETDTFFTQNEINLN